MLANHWSTDANSKRDECLIGVLSPEGVKAMNEDAVRAAKELAKIKSERKDKALQPDVFTQAKLVKKHAESHDTKYVPDPSLFYAVLRPIWLQALHVRSAQTARRQSWVAWTAHRQARLYCRAFQGPGGLAALHSHTPSLARGGRRHVRSPREDVPAFG